MAYRKIYIQGRCYLCYQDDLVRTRLNQIQAQFAHPVSEYNQYLFDLYLIYLRRYRMSYDHLKPTLGLMQYLAQTPIHPIRRWSDIYTLSRAHPLTRSPGKPIHDNGCAWMKIGYMLQELDVLGPRPDEYQHRVATLLQDMTSSTAEQVMVFAKLLKKSGRTDASVNHYITDLKSLSHWLSELDPPETLTLAQMPSLECYLDQMRKMRTYSSLVVTFRRIAAFYRFAKRARLILQNPTQNIRLSRAAEKLVIISKTQFDQLHAFLRDPLANAPQAMAVTLILFFGFTTADLAGASVDCDPQTRDRLKIILARRPRSRGRRHYNREQELTLPSDPPWIKDLSKRFIDNWQTAFAKLKPKVSFPRTPLFLDPQLQYNRNMSDDYIRTLIKAATVGATGTSIPPRILRQTCGCIMTRGDDASALGHLGWSPQFAFHYTWLPKIQF